MKFKDLPLSLRSQLSAAVVGVADHIGSTDYKALSAVMRAAAKHVSQNHAVAAVKTNPEAEDTVQTEEAAHTPQPGPSVTLSATVSQMVLWSGDVDEKGLSIWSQQPDKKLTGPEELYAYLLGTFSVVLSGDEEAAKTIAKDITEAFGRNMGAHIAQGYGTEECSVADPTGAPHAVTVTLKIGQ